MSISVVDLYSKEYISMLGAEYVNTGFMFDTQETKKDLPEQMASFDFIGVVGDEYDLETGEMIIEDQYNMKASTQNTGGSMGGQSGGMGGGSY
jgi:hypothetical protein